MPDISLTDYSTELSAIERRRKLAELMQQKAMQPIETPAPVNGWAIKTPGISVLAKMLQGYAGAKGLEAADERQKALAEGLKSEADAWLASKPRKADAVPANIDPSGDPFSSSPGIAAQDEPTKDDILAWAGKGMKNPHSKMLAEIIAKQAIKPPKFGSAGPSSTIFNEETGIPSQQTPAAPSKPMLVEEAGPDGTPTQRFVNPDVNAAPMQKPVKKEIGPAGQPYNPFTLAQVLRDPNKPFNANEQGGAEPNVAFQQYEKGLREAGRPQVQTRVNVPPASQVFQNENKLRDDYTTASKPFVAIRDAYNTVQASLAGPITAVSTLAGATKFMKMIDPESVVRESELQMALKASGMFDRFMNLHNTVIKGQVLTETQAEEIKKIASVLYDTASKQQQKTDQYYGGLATQYGLSPGRVTRNQSAVMAHPSDQPSRITSDAEYNALQPGTLFVGPDGKQRRKP